MPDVNGVEETHGEWVVEERSAETLPLTRYAITNGDGYLIAGEIDNPANARILGASKKLQAALKVFTTNSVIAKFLLETDPQAWHQAIRALGDAWGLHSGMTDDDDEEETCPTCGKELEHFMHNCPGSIVYPEIYGCPDCDDHCSNCSQGK